MNIRSLLIPGVALLLVGCVAPRPTTRPVAANRAPQITGVASCDAYLADYLAGHRAAAIFPADQLQTHYQTMRDTLVDAARNPHTRPYLDARCRLLSSQLAAIQPRVSLR